MRWVQFAVKIIVICSMLVEQFQDVKATLPFQGAD